MTVFLRKNVQQFELIAFIMRNLIASLAGEKSINRKLTS